MQTALAFKAITVDPSLIVRPATPGASPRPRTPGRRILKIAARKWDMVGVLTLMGSTAIYSIGQLMSLAR